MRQRRLAALALTRPAGRDQHVPLAMMPGSRSALEWAAVASCLAMIAPPARAEPSVTRAGLVAGVAVPGGDQAHAGPAVGAELALALTSRLGLVAGALLSRHTFVWSDAAVATALTATLGPEVCLDLAPVVPTLGLGVALQRTTAGETVQLVPGGFLRLGLFAPVGRRFLVGLEVQYLTESFSASGLPAFLTATLSVGWAPFDSSP